MSRPTPPNSPAHTLKLLLSLVLDYVRWTQLAPMILMWGIALLMLLALTVVNFQEQTISTSHAILQWLVQLPIVGQHIAQMASQAGTETHITTRDFESFMFSAWSAISLTLMLASLLLSWLLGPRPPWKLTRKLLWAAIAAILLLSGLVFNYFANPVKFNGGAAVWIFNFSLLSLAAFLVSIYSLSISHFLRFLNGTLLAEQSRGA